jgi:rhodanese-related sulfurtransferase
VLISKEKGLTNTAALLGGTEAWKNAGYPMEGETAKPAPVNKP